MIRRDFNFNGKNYTFDYVRYDNDKEHRFYIYDQFNVAINGNEYSLAKKYVMDNFFLEFEMYRNIIVGSS